MSLNSQINNQSNLEETGFELDQLRQSLQNIFSRCNNLHKMHRDHLVIVQGCSDFQDKDQNYYNIDYNLRNEHELFSLDITYFNVIQTNSNLYNLLEDYQKKSNLYLQACQALINVEFPCRKIFFTQIHNAHQLLLEALGKIGVEAVSAIKKTYEFRYHQNIKNFINDARSGFRERLKAYFDYTIKTLLTLNAGAATALLAFIGTSPKPESVLLSTTPLS